MYTVTDKNTTRNFQHFLFFELKIMFFKYNYTRFTSNNFPYKSVMMYFTYDYYDVTSCV